MDGATAYHQPQRPSFNLVQGLNFISISKRHGKEHRVGKYNTVRNSLTVEPSRLHMFQQTDMSSLRFIKECDVMPSTPVLVATNNYSAN